MHLFIDAFHQHQDATLLDELCGLDFVPSTLRQRSRTLVPHAIEDVFEAVQDVDLFCPCVCMR